MAIETLRAPWRGKKESEWRPTTSGSPSKNAGRRAGSLLGLCRLDSFCSQLALPDSRRATAAQGIAVAVAARRVNHRREAVSAPLIPSHAMGEERRMTVPAREAASTWSPLSDCVSFTLSTVVLSRISDPSRSSSHRVRGSRYVSICTIHPSRTESLLRHGQPKLRQRCEASLRKVQRIL